MDGEKREEEEAGIHFPHFMSPEGQDKHGVSRGLLEQEQAESTRAGRLACLVSGLSTYPSVHPIPPLPLSHPLHDSLPACLNDACVCA